MVQFLASLPIWMLLSIVIAVAALLAAISNIALFSVLAKIAKRTGSNIDDTLVRHLRRPTTLIFPLLVVFFILPFMAIPSDILILIRHTIEIVLIASIGWLVLETLNAFNELAIQRYNMEKADIMVRNIRTRIQLLHRISSVVVGIVTLAAIMMTIPGIRNIGASLFASAGIAGLVVGIAARPMLSNLIAGIQIVLTGPIRIDDTVIVEGEWGWIEEIRTTYVVVRTWDLRRLIVPLSYFIDRPFQNWTRVSPDLIGTIFIYTDYTVPVEEVRQELHQILKSSGIWDGKVWGLQVTNTSERTVELRALMSAPDAQKTWNLRCYVREKLIRFLQEKYPHNLPKIRNVNINYTGGNHE